MRPTPLTSVVVPVYLNRPTLRELHRRLTGVLERESGSHEVIFVDDASPDRSVDVLEKLAETDPRVCVLMLAHNVGQHRAVLEGLRHARGSRAVVIDADLQDPPDAIPRLLAHVGTKAAAVFAGRRGRYETAGRLLTSRAFKLALHVLAGVPADAGLFVAMDRRMIDRLLAFSDGRPFLVAMMGRAGLPLASVPVERSLRADGESAYSAWDRFATGSRALLWTVAWRTGLRRRGRPAPPGPVARYIGARFAAGTSPARGPAP